MVKMVLASTDYFRRGHVCRGLASVLWLRAGSGGCNMLSITLILVANLLALMTFALIVATHGGDMLVIIALLVGVLGIAKLLVVTLKRANNSN